MLKSHQTLPMTVSVDEQIGIIMLVRAQYNLSPNAQQKDELLKLHRDYSNLCNEIADLVRAKIPADACLDIRRVGAIVDEALKGRKGVPTRYIHLAKLRVLWHLGQDRDVVFDPTFSVDVDEMVATPNIGGNLIGEPQMVLDIKMFDSKSRERVSVPCEWKQIPHLTAGRKAGGASLRRESDSEWVVVLTAEVKE